jgi:hypothetical protein
MYQQGTDTVNYHLFKLQDTDPRTKRMESSVAADLGQGASETSDTYRMVSFPQETTMHTYMYTVCLHSTLYLLKSVWSFLWSRIKQTHLNTTSAVRLHFCQLLTIIFLFESVQSIQKSEKPKMGQYFGSLYN